MQVFLENVIRDAVTYTEHARRKTVTAFDVVYALKRQGRTLYGFGGWVVCLTTTPGDFNHHQLLLALISVRIVPWILILKAILLKWYNSNFCLRLSAVVFCIKWMKMSSPNFQQCMQICVLAKPIGWPERPSANGIHSVHQVCHVYAKRCLAAYMVQASGNY